MSDTSSPATETQNYQGILQPRGFPGLPAGWVSEWETFPSADRTLQLFGVLHRPHEKWASPRLLVVIHGLGEHGGRYLHFPHYLAGAVDAVYCLDNRGHGRSEGTRGHVDHFDQYVDDVVVLLRRLDEQLRKRFGTSEIHVFGHSMGGLIALRTMLSAKNLPVKSLALSAPLLGIKVQIPWVKRAAAGTLSKLWGSLQLANEIDVSTVSHDPEVVRAYASDRLVHSRITPKTFTGMLSAIEETRTNTDLAYPLLMIVPGEDQITDSEAALQYFRALKGRGKELKEYPGFFHESFNEIEKEKPFADLKKWISR